MEGSSVDRVRRAARQHLRTSQYFGVEFLPRAVVIPVDEVDDDAAPGRDADQVSDSPGTVRSLNGIHHSDHTNSASHIDRDVPSWTTSKNRALQELRDRHDAECPHCTVVTSHTQTVFGEGDPDAQVMFIGEAPGEEEDRTGRPFVGRAGQKLNEIIKAMGFTREQVYIANVLKSRPPDNRTPLEHEVLACSPFLVEQIRIIHPKVIVSLGGPASKMLLRTDTGITRLRGLWGSYDNAAAGLSIPVMPTFHPAYLLRNYTPDTRQKMWSDMQAVVKKLAE
jgi:uracil-DNA glycosylase family 4